MKALLLILFCAVTVSAVAALRKVDGKIYEPVTDHTWRSVEGKAIQIIGKDVLLSVSGLDEPVYLKNAPNVESLLDGDRVSCQALFVGAKEYMSVLGVKKRVAAYDAGTIPTDKEAEPFRKVLEQARIKEQERQETLERERKRAEEERQKERTRITTQQLARIIAYQEVQASNGLPSFQYELGRRYLRGEGVETNLTLARHWLQSACTNGYSAATNLLSTIK